MNRKRFTSIIYGVCTLPIIFIILLMNLRFASINSLKSIESAEAAVPQLKHLFIKMHCGAAESMQSVYPEGFVFMNALYGLSCAELGSMATLPDTLRYYWLEEGKWALDKIESAEGTEAFQTAADICPEFGIFYSGWSNYLRAKLYSAHPINGVIDSASFTTACIRIAKCFGQSTTPYLETYPSASWPADNFTAIASLVIHDRLLAPQFVELISSWLENVDTRWDHQTDLVPHSVNAYTGIPDEGARGCSQTLIIRLLFEIDSSRALAHYDNFRRQFVTTFLGIPAIREYPKGYSGHGDIDSGPVLFGFGSAATLVGLGTARMAGDVSLANGLSGFVECAGLPITFQGRKFYGLGLLPIGDAFLCWSRISKIGKGYTPTEGEAYSGFLFHVMCMVLSVCLLIPLVFILRKKEN